jgi:hypothetical protein
MMCEKLERHVKIGLWCPILRFIRVCCFTSSAMTLRGYENRWSPLCTLMSFRTISHCLPVLFFTPEEKEKEKKVKMKGKLVIEFP